MTELFGGLYLDDEGKKEKGRRTKSDSGAQLKDKALAVLRVWCAVYENEFELPYYPTPDDWSAAVGFVTCNPDLRVDELRPLMVKCLKEFPRLPQFRYLTATYRSRILPSFKLFVQSINDLVALEKTVFGGWLYDDEWVRVKGSGVR